VLELILKRSAARSLPWVLAAASLAIACCVAPPAFAGEPVNKEDFKKFSNCPAAISSTCLYGETLSGAFKIGSKTVPITNPVILQGGVSGSVFETLPLLQPLNGAEAVSASPQPIPGGLTGLSEIIGGPASATAEVAGPASIVKVAQFKLASETGTAVELPIKVHLENAVLGSECYIGSDAEPIVLHLTTGTTSPPAGTEPIKGKLGTIVTKDKSRLIEYHENSLVDNTFAVPAATGCGTVPLLSAVITAAVNLDAGLPSAAGNNYAELDGNLYTSLATYVAKYDKVKKVKKH
jgi:hypothetical protein